MVQGLWFTLPAPCTKYYGLADLVKGSRCQQHALCNMDPAGALRLGTSRDSMGVGVYYGRGTPVHAGPDTQHPTRWTLHKPHHPTRWTRHATRACFGDSLLEPGRDVWVEGSHPCSYTRVGPLTATRSPELTLELHAVREHATRACFGDMLFEPGRDVEVKGPAVGCGVWDPYSYTRAGPLQLHVRGSPTATRSPAATH